MLPYGALSRSEAQVAASLILMKGGGPWKLASTKFTWGTTKGDWCYTQDIYKKGLINKSHGSLSYFHAHNVLYTFSATHVFPSYQPSLQPFPSTFSLGTSGNTFYVIKQILPVPYH